MKVYCNREGMNMKKYHTCDYRYNFSWHEPDENVKNCIKKNKTVNKIRKELMKKRFEKNRDKISPKEAN